ncbi:MAG: hypothetical protein RLZ12_364 [Bacillota bacterium]|jgi:hypothetical protein
MKNSSLFRKLSIASIACTSLFGLIGTTGAVKKQPAKKATKTVQRKQPVKQVVAKGKSNAFIYASKFDLKLKYNNPLLDLKLIKTPGGSKFKVTNKKITIPATTQVKVLKNAIYWHRGPCKGTTDVSVCDKCGQGYYFVTYKDSKGKEVTGWIRANTSKH